MNRLFFLLTGSAVLLLCGCQKQTDDATALSQSRFEKPSIAIAPVIDSSESGVCWDLSDEFTYSVSSRLAQRAKISVVDPQRTKMQIKKLKLSHNPFGSDLAWMKQTFAGEDFVAFMELIEHREALDEEKEQKNPEASAAHLNLAMRLRIVDVKSNEPKVILQEIIQDSHFIPRQFTSYNFSQSPWNSEDFAISPVGIAHSLLVKELSARIEDYLSLPRRG
jgi:hypothetical protein